ncbi:MAG: hypothetical protein HUU47_09135 [Bacteroidetes bacterium]|nr:hypothetical protein [Bacteroidota bacterium]
MKTTNIKQQKSYVLIVLTIFLMGLTYKSKAQSSCCQITTTSEVDCYLAIKIKCNGSYLNCTDTANTNNCNPSPCYMGGCFVSDFVIQPGTSFYPSTTTATFDITKCPCDLEIELFGVGFVLNGNTTFNSTHTNDHLGTLGSCCPGGIEVVFDPAACTLLITMPSCP